jgi:hypothetical protein
MEPNVLEPQPNASYKGMIEDHTYEIRSVTPRSGHHVEEPIKTFIESIEYYTNTLFIDPLVPPLTDPIS